MIKIKNAKHSNLLFGTMLFLGFLLTWGCTKNVAPPDVEEPPAPVVEAIPTPEGQEELDLAQEEVDGIQESGADFAGSGIETEGPDAIDSIDSIDEIDVVEVTPPPVEKDSTFESSSVPETDFTQESGFGIEPETEVSEAAPMEMQEDVFVAPGAEKIQEARPIIDFKDEQQLQDIHFEYDRDKLDSQTKNILQANADWLKKNPKARD